MNNKEAMQPAMKWQNTDPEHDSVWDAVLASALQEASSLGLDEYYRHYSQLKSCYNTSIDNKGAQNE